MLDLFDFLNPVAHTADPPTSAEAAARVTASGRRAAHARLVLALVRRHPGSTAVELWAAANAGEQADLGEMQEVRRRLTDLLHAGRVRQGDARACRVRKSKMVTWSAA
jgi:hypothetical protein